MASIITDIPLSLRDHESIWEVARGTSLRQGRYDLACSCGTWEVTRRTYKDAGHLFDQHLTQHFTDWTARPCRGCGRLLFNVRPAEWVHADVLSLHNKEPNPTNTRLYVVHDDSTHRPLTTPATQASAQASLRWLLTSKYRARPRTDLSIKAITPAQPEAPH